MVTNCEIKFDNSNNGTFYSGQMLTGKIVLNLTEKKKVRCKFKNTSNNLLHIRLLFLKKRRSNSQGREIA
jgi:hypothetical protein